MRATLFVRNKMRKPIIKKGDKYNRLTAIRFDHKRRSYQYWLFQCDCGNKKVLNVSEVKRGRSKSCGCLVKERLTTHGMKYTREYSIWVGMKQRCLNKNSKSYKNYGGRGITVCKRWLKFENFYKDIGKRPSSKYSLDRIDNNGNYEPKNCRWATRSEQGLNKNKSVIVNINNKKFDGFTEASKYFGVSITTIKRWCDGYIDYRRINQNSKGIVKPRENCFYIKKYEDI